MQWCNYWRVTTVASSAIIKGGSSRTAEGINFKLSAFDFWEILNHFIQLLLLMHSKSKSFSLFVGILHRLASYIPSFSFELLSK